MIYLNKLILYFIDPKALLFMDNLPEAFLFPEFLKTLL
ncbi:hypothetical protein LEP1GSC125_3938 [Leptospira mayottensis 200901122]|uniref:Uncharacterized protein n=1 Tax=Leptospira mayottensis 200901122 TaxID=1193010 RepID=A0AA87SYG1_9LEPT|nr:hypothetical protein LEP1GSC125_3938 [Leptospira mayottensis 200901122]